MSENLPCSFLKVFAQLIPQRDGQVLSFKCLHPSFVSCAQNAAYITSKLGLKSVERLKQSGGAGRGGPALHIWCAHAPWSRFTADPGWADVLQRLHAAHCHAGPCQQSSEGACRSFSSSALINMLLIGCWRDSRDDWLLWHSGPLFDFVEPYWNQSEAVQIARFVMTLVEGVVNRWWHRLRINITHIKHPGLHAPFFFLLSGANIKSCCQHRNYKSRYTEGGGGGVCQMEIFISVCSFLYNTHCWWVLALSLCHFFVQRWSFESAFIFRWRIMRREKIKKHQPDWVWINNIDHLDHLRAEG